MPLKQGDKVLLDEVFESDPKMQQQFNSLTNMSQYHPSIIVDSLLKWRRSQLLEISQMMASKDLKKASKEEISLIEERIRLGVEYIFARALIPILDSLTFHKATLDPAFCEEIENIAFSFFKASKKSDENVEDDSVLGNRKKIPTLYAKVVGILSETRFSAIYPKFLKATTDTPVRSKKATFVVLGVRYVRFLMESAEGMEQSMAFMNSLLKLFKAAQPIEVKQAIAELLVRLLRAAICTISPTCDYTNWYNMLLEIYTSHAFHPKKSKVNKETVALIPMVTAILCSLRKSDFLEHYRDWLSRLYAALKEYKTRTVALENILFIVEIFYLKVGNELQSALHVLLEEVGSIVLTYCTLKRPMNDKADMLDIFVDMVHAMAQLSLNFAVEDVILKLLAFTNTPAPVLDTTAPSTSSSSLTGSSFLPFTFSSAPNPYAFACEKVIVAVRATVQLRLGETSSNEKTSKRLFTVPPKDLLNIVHNHLVQAAQPINPIIAPIPQAAAKEASSKANLKETRESSKESKESKESRESSKEASKESKEAKDNARSSPKDFRDPNSKEAEKKSDPVKPSTPIVAFPVSPTHVLIPPFYNALVSREAQLTMLNPYWDNITTIWAQILLHLDSVLGHLLYSTSYKTLYDMIRPERDIIAIQLLQLLLQSIPTVVPKLPIPKLVSILSKYIIHLDKGIEEMSTGALTRLMTWRPDFRPLIISGLADFSTTISHNRHDLIFTLLFKIGQLFKQWLDIVKPPFDLPKGSRVPPSTAADLDNFPVTKIEGIALIFLCSSTSKIRLLALEILKAVRSVETLLRKSSLAPPMRSFANSVLAASMSNTPSRASFSGASGPITSGGMLVGGVQGLSMGQLPPFPFSNVAEAPLPPIRIMDIIDEAGPDIIRTLQSETRHFSLRSIPIAAKTIERLAAKDSREDQWMWSSVLGELLRHFIMLQPEPALLAAYYIQGRLREVKPDDKEIAPEQEEMLYWWRNYITLECVVLVPHFPQLLPSIFNNSGPASGNAGSANSAGMSTSASSHAGSTHGASSAVLNAGLGGGTNYSTNASASSLFHHHGGTERSSSGAHLSRELSSSSSAGNSSRSDQLGSQSISFMLPKDIFALILPYLRSSNDMLRESSVMALQRTNFASAEVLTECLRSFEKEFQGDHSDKKRKQKRNRLRLEVTSIYTSILESIHQTALCRNPKLKKHIVFFIVELYQHLKSNRNLFDMLQLRYQFCVIVSRLAEELHAGTIASKDFHQSKEEITLRKNAFQLLSTWCSSDIFQDEGTKKHLNSLLSTIKDAEKRKAYINALREHILMLQFSALTAMSSCLRGPHFDEILSGDQFFDFVDGFLRHSLDKVRLLARFMLESFLSGNLSQPHVLHTTLNKSYHVDSDIANQYFLCLVTLFPEDIIFSCSEVTLFHLIVYMIGNSDFHVRRAARELLLMLKSLTNSDEQWLTTVPFVVDSSLPENYERAQIDLSVRLADFHPESAPEMITEMVVRLDMVSPNSKRQMLRSILPWIEKLEFHTVSRAVLDSLMENLLFVTVKYKQDFPREVEQLWTTVARTNRNLQVVIRELIAIGMVRQNTEIIPLAKFVCIYLARTASKVVIDTLVLELSAGELPISNSRRNTLTHSDRQAVSAFLKRTNNATNSNNGGGGRTGTSSLGGSQSNSHASVPSFNADHDLDDDSETNITPRARAKSDASSLDKETTQRPRSQTIGERLAVPLHSPIVSRRLSSGGTEKDALVPQNNASGANTSTVRDSASSGAVPSTSPQSTLRKDSVASEHRPVADAMVPNKRAKSSKLVPSEQPAFSSPPDVTSTPIAVKVRSRSKPRSRSNKRRRNVPNFSTLGSSDDEDSSGGGAGTSPTYGAHPFQNLIPVLTEPWGLTRAHFILTILAQLTYETSEQFRDHLPIIFQLAFLGIDFPNPLVYEHCRIILLNVIHSLIVLPLEQVDNKSWGLQEKYSESLHLVEYLRANQGEPLWAHEDVTMKKPEIRSASQLTSLVQAIIKAFSPANRAVSSSTGDLAETWAAQALTWAVHGQSWHITGRSFQIYRALRPAITRDAQNDLLECLLRSMSTKTSKRRSSKSNSAASASPTQSKENLALTIEVLITLQTLVRAQSTQKLILFPQMFWTSVALLHTDYEQHYLASLKLLSDLLDRLDLSDTYVQNIFSASIPKEWQPPFRGIQHLVARGLFSPMAEQKALDVLAKLIPIPFDRVLHPEPGRLLHLIICLLPFVCSNMRSPSDSTLKRQSSEIAAHLSQACAQERLSDLSRIFAKLSCFEYDSIEEFVWDFRRPFGVALTQLQISVLNGTYRSPDGSVYPLNASSSNFGSSSSSSHAQGSSNSGFNSLSSTTPSKLPLGSQLHQNTSPTGASSSSVSVSAPTILAGGVNSGNVANSSNSGASSGAAASPSLQTNTANSGPDESTTQSMTDSGVASEQKIPFFRLESALSILFNILEFSSSSWRRATLLIILALLQHRYPPPSMAVGGGSNSSLSLNSNLSSPSTPRSASQFSERASGGNTDALRVPGSNLSVGSANEARKSSIGSGEKNVSAPEPLERVMQPSWLVTLLKQMSSSSWQQTLLILDLALQHSAITVSELDPFVLKSSKSMSQTNSNTNAASSPTTSDIEGSAGPVTSSKSSRNREMPGSHEFFFCNRNSIGVASASLALDKILSTEHRRRNLTLDPSVLSMFDGWYSKEATGAPPAKSLRSKKLSSVAELDSDADESISTEEQISYLLQTEKSKNSAAKQVDPFDALSTPVSSSTLGRFPTFRGFDELLSKLESMPSTPMATMDSKPSTGLFPDALSSSTILSASSSSVNGSVELKHGTISNNTSGLGGSGDSTVIRKSSSKKMKPVIKPAILAIDSTGSENTETYSADDVATASSSAPSLASIATNASISAATMSTTTMTQHSSSNMNNPSSSVGGSGKLKTPRKAGSKKELGHSSPTETRASSSSSSSSPPSSSLSSSDDESGNADDTKTSVRRSNSHKFRMGLAPSSGSRAVGSLSSKYQGESQGESSANDSDTPFSGGRSGGNILGKEKDSNFAAGPSSSAVSPGNSNSSAINKEIGSGAASSGTSSSRKASKHKRLSSPSAAAASAPSSSSSTTASRLHSKQKSTSPPNSSDSLSKNRSATLGRSTPPKSGSNASSSSLKKRSKTSVPVSTSSKYPSGASDEQNSVSPASSARLKKLAFSFSSELLARTKRWRSAVQNDSLSGAEPSSAEELPAIFKIFTSAAKLLTSIRADFRSCLTPYCRLVVPTNQGEGGKGSSSHKDRKRNAHDRNAPHRALSELLTRMTADLDTVVPSIPDIMIEMMPLKYKRVTKRDVSFATSFRDQRTKFIEDVQQAHLAYTEQRISTENIKCRLQQLESDLIDMSEDSSSIDRDEQCLVVEKVSNEFAIAALQLHLIALNTLSLQVSAGPIVSQLLESYSSDAVETAEEIINAEIARSKSLISSLQNNLVTYD